jgi:hypothetical protein
VVAAQIQLHCCAPFTAVTHPPLSPQRAASVFGHRVLTAVAVREQVNRCSMSRARWSTALGRGTHGGFVVGQAGQGLLSTPLRRVRRLLAPRCRFSRPLVDSNTPTPHRSRRVHSTTEGHLGVHPLFWGRVHSEGGARCSKCVKTLAVQCRRTAVHGERVSVHHATCGQATQA